MKTPAELGGAPAHSFINLPALRRQIEQKGISYRTIARRAHVDRTHLQRVLSGQRPGSQVLLRSISRVVEGFQSRHVQEEDMRLINAAVHVFLLKRGWFESEVFRPGKTCCSIKGGRP